MARDMPVIARVVAAIPWVAGWAVLCCAPVILGAAWLGLYVGSERSEKIFDSFANNGHFSGAHRVTALYCNYLTFGGIRTHVIEATGTRTINGKVVDIDCPWLYPRPYI